MVEQQLNKLRPPADCVSCRIFTSGGLYAMSLLCLTSFKRRPDKTIDKYFIRTFSAGKSIAA